jgi:hypothetical protein
VKIRKSLAALGLVAVLSTTAACSADALTSSGSSTASTTSSSRAADSGAATGATAGGPDAVDVSSVSSEEDLVALVQEAHGDAGLGLHRGHEPVQDVLDEVLTISHEELHVRMEEQGQNLAAVATGLGVDPQTLVDAVVEAWSPAIDTLLENGTVTQEEADAYRAALEEAFTFRVTWDGETTTPTFSGLDA